MIKEEEDNMDDPNPLQDLNNGFKETELDNLGSLERELPIELSFLIRQQAYCMARMNYLDRQIRELKETRQQQQQAQLNPNQNSSTLAHNSLAAAAAGGHTMRLGPVQPTGAQQQYQNFNHHQQHYHAQAMGHAQPQQQHLIRAGQTTLATTTVPNQGGPAAASTHIKNGFIPSDDSGGEYSRATISDDDELSSLLDQIAKSVRPNNPGPAAPAEAQLRGPSNPILVNQQQAQTQQHQLLLNSNQPQPMSTLQGALLQQRAQHHHYSVINTQPQSYAIIQPNQMQQHQALPVFVMGSTIATAHPASSISSTVLPGVHFQPEPRYNQYYEDFYTVQGNLQQQMLLHQANNTTSSLINTNSRLQQLHQQQQPQQQSLAGRSRQFENSLAAIEQLVSQRERRQFKTQLKSADNWLKMRSSGLYNLSEFNATNLSSQSSGNSKQTLKNNPASSAGGDGGGSGNNSNTNHESATTNSGLAFDASGRNLSTSGSTTTTAAAIATAPNKSGNSAAGNNSSSNSNNNSSSSNVIEANKIR